MQNLSIITNGTKRTGHLSKGKLRNRMDLTFQVSHLISCFFYQKERWFPQTSTGLPSSEEVVVKAIRELKKSPVKSVKFSKWSIEDRLLCYRGKIYVSKTDLHRKITALFHDSKIVEHPRRWKTLELVSWNYWWPQMSRYIGKYVSTCDMCLCTKTIKRPPTWELHLLPIPDTPWDTVSVDFITELPEFNRWDSIMVVVDSVTKWSHFVSMVTTLSSIGVAQLYVQHVWKHHRLPRRVVSDRGLQFVAEFTREIYWLLGIMLAATTAYHPQGDGQTKRVNQELEQFLQLFINQGQDDWDDLLPFAEFQYNNHVHSATQNVPFLLDTSDGIWTRTMLFPSRVCKWIQGMNGRCINGS